MKRNTAKCHKKVPFSSTLILGVAFLGFIVIGLAVSISIRACTHHKEYIRKEPYRYGASADSTYADVEETSNMSSDSVMPDSVIRICMPLPLENVSEQIIHKSSYIASYNKDTKIPNWVAWHLTAEHTDGPYRRLSNFYEEESIATQRVTIEDYRGSGWSRGHMCPAGDNKWDETAMYDSFSLVNVCPQNANLNSGLWNSIEIDCRRWARQFGDIYIVCGPVFLNREHETIGENEVFVPEAFFKVVLCLNGIPKALGFIVRNTDGNRKRDLYYNTIDQVERITGIDFFPSLPDDMESEVESHADIEDWR